MRVHPSQLPAWLALLALAACGRPDSAGRIEGEALPEAVVAQRAEAQRGAAVGIAQAARSQPPARQILFGDLHVHSTFSADAFLMSLPILQGEGAHPVADACDFARYCSGVDFWSINDHAESITPRRWRETRESIRQCNARAGDPANPDVVAYLGWEWTQVGLTPEDHYGHKNVILRETADDAVPARPIDSAGFTTRAMRRPLRFGQRVLLPLLDFENRQRYLDQGAFLDEIRDTPRCEEGVDVRELPEECMEGAASPDVLFEKLAQWGHESMVIPHGTTWGIYTPPGSSWDKQLVGAMHDPERQRLIEVFSGHGNSEEYRDWRAVETDADGNRVCPAPTSGYEPCCWRAGEIIRSRCQDPGSDGCRQRVEAARANHLAAGAAGRVTVPGTTMEDWLGCGQCYDCFQPAYNYRPGGAAQYIMSLGNFDGDQPRHFDFGFMASSDNHSARPGTGYKEFARLQMTEARGARDEEWYERVNDLAGEEPAPESRPIDPATNTEINPYELLDFERQATFWLTGGLAAVHSQGRSREAIWDALERREVYGTSGPRILLWFDLLNGPDGEVPMGRQVALAEAPSFRVRAVGSFQQQDGCPEFSTNGLSPERLERLCRGECYHPSDQRHPIDRIEVVRIRPQVTPDEDPRDLIEDPWETFVCEPDAEGCSVEFTDEEYAGSTRPHLYYVRAIQSPTYSVNARGVRCRFDAQGRCIEVRPCYGDYRTDPSDDCLASAEERAWSSPITLRGN